MVPAGKYIACDAVASVSLLAGRWLVAGEVLAKRASHHHAPRTRVETALLSNTEPSWSSTHLVALDVHTDLRLLGLGRSPTDLA
jgi:hypothetical protein